MLNFFHNYVTTKSAKIKEQQLKTMTAYVIYEANLNC
jgi:hypothetical protein